MNNNDNYKYINLFSNEILTQEPQEFVNTDIKEKQWSWRWGALPTKNMNYRPSVDILELNKNLKKESLNLKNYLENRKKFSNKNATLTYQEKVENYLADNKDYMLNNDASAINENIANTTSIENDYTLNHTSNNNILNSSNNINDNSHPNLSEKDKHDSNNEFGLFNLLDIFENGEIQISNCKFNDIIKLPDDVNIDFYFFIYYFNNKYTIIIITIIIIIITIIIIIIITIIIFTIVTITITTTTIIIIKL